MDLDSPDSKYFFNQKKIQAGPCFKLLSDSSNLDDLEKNLARVHNVKVQCSLQRSDRSKKMRCENQPDVELEFDLFCLKFDLSVSGSDFLLLQCLCLDLAIAMRKSFFQCRLQKLRTN